ncbi:TraR/DksA family transcriptional regulator [Paraliomyxa miuraensis]|uniref:TraR/DksA family transcriptional regulator n=1 Tax=Paraliomyxa miuraensis TaxID=376150 RepID=UPI002251BA43|nr:TraR/DksA C4-type zinc finger protein [Paraliomyxa miuraensis]MCX4246446.1 TraR/DksA C4-type zinc finger protein [Paraliomyxa miuraensis]
MDARTNERYRKRLLELREELRREGAVEIEPLREGLEPTEKIDEDAAPLTEMNQVIASNRNRLRTRRLQQIAEALERLDEEPDEFGLCESCDEPIPPRRMELQPWVHLCITCQSEQEEQDAPGSRKHLTDYR